MGSLLSVEWKPERGTDLQHLDRVTVDEEIPADTCVLITLECIFPKRSLYSTNRYYEYYKGQLGYDHFFDLYLDLCGICIKGQGDVDDECDFEWNSFRNYLGKNYNHVNILTCKDFLETTVMRYVRVGINFGEDLDELVFRQDEEKRRLEEFGKLGSKLLKYPVQGQQLFCTINTGDMYTATFMKFPFMTEVFKHLGLSTKSAIMSTMEARLKTCKRLQNTYDASVEDFAYNLAEAGLYLTTDEILSQCFECGGLVNIGKCDFDPWKVHAKYHPCCPYLLKIKGQEYVDRIRRDFKDQVDINPRCILQFDSRWHAPDTEDNDDSDWTESASDCSDYYSENESDETDEDILWQN